MTKQELENQMASLSRELDEMRSAIRNSAQRFNNLEDRLLEMDKKIVDQQVEIAKLKAAPAARPPAPKQQSGVIRY